MALLVAESFDDLPSGTGSAYLLNKRYWSGAVITQFNHSGGRTPGRYHGWAKTAQTSGSPDVLWTLPAPLSEFYGALAVNRTGSNTGSVIVLAFRDGASNQIEMRMAGGVDGSTLQFTRNGVALGNVASVFPLGVWVWLSVRIVISNTAGIIEVRNGVGDVLLNLTGLNTQATANPHVNAVGFLEGSIKAIDDVFLMDTSGATFNGHLTERAIRTLFPAADGTTLDWTANGASARWDCVNEQTPDDDTTYLSSGTVGQVNLSALSDMATAETGIEAVIVQHRSRKDDVGARSVRGLLRTGGTNYNGATVALASGYVNVADKWELNPTTSSPFTRTEVDALEAGVEVVS
jgi:hypothetical protein